MAARVCPTPGCPRLIPRGQQHCPTHSRGTSTQRGYGQQHATTRANYQARMDAGEVIPCWRCGRSVNPQHWHLGHDDHDRTITRGPEHPNECNLRAAGRAGAAQTNN